MLQLEMLFWYCRLLLWWLVQLQSKVLLLTHALSSRRCVMGHGSATHQPSVGLCYASCAGNARTSSSDEPDHQRC